MTEERIKTLLHKLRTEVDNAQAVDADTVKRARKLEADIQDLVNPEVASDHTTVLDDAIALEASFAANHPVAEKIIRELINSLSKMGI